MNSLKVQGWLKPFLLVMSAVVLSFSATVSAPAKSAEDSIEKTKQFVSVNVSIDDPKVTRTVNAPVLKRQLTRLVERKVKANPKLAKSLCVPCSCTAVPDYADGFGSCFSGCLQAWGISYGTVLACGGICAVAATGNPVGIGVCAACLGTGEWIVAGCALRCLWNRGYAGLEEARLRPAKGRRLPRVKLTTTSAYAG